ncbi:hypothetical protein PC114_g4697 [Phytophthora cactorum]|nr:hypothetical protein PC114_g4697 [Phytophthora cactorum]
MPLSNRAICAILFQEETPGKFVCSSCSRTYRSAQGFTNLINHLRRFHPSNEAEAETALRETNALRLHIVDARTNDIFRWVLLVVMERLTFSFCERQLVRQSTKMTDISEKTLTRCIMLLHQHIHGRIVGVLPLKFGIVLDGWTCGGRHYVSIFAVFDDSSSHPSYARKDDDYFNDLDRPSRRFLLLAFSPVDDEEDLGAQSLFDLIADTLSRFQRPWESMLFMVGDNCSVNQYIGRRIGAIPLIGCARHRFNFAMNDFLAPDKPLLTRVHAVMKRLTTIKCRAMLRKLTHLAPVMRNATRWSSVYAMVKRYTELMPFLLKIDHGSVADYDLESYLLSPCESERVTTLCGDLEKLNGVTQTLQKSTLTLSGVRRLFDHVLAEYPQLDARLGTAATIINNQPLELADDEQGHAETPEERSSFFRSTFKRRKSNRRQRYMDVGFVPPTSNECERFFSAAKLVLTDLRKSMEPERVEAVMSLSINRELWDVYAVEIIRHRLGENARD